ncbi:hypothetical protein JCM11641_003969 [Rhodosporidiobolus odoratus]
MTPTAQFIPAPALGSTSTSSHSHDHHSHDQATGGGHSHDHGAQEHGHTHELMEHPGKFAERDLPDWSLRNFAERGFTIGIGGPVGSGKTALTLALCRYFRDSHNIAVVTNDIFTKEDQEFLIRNEALSDPGRIRAIETGGCPHAAIREDISANMGALEDLQATYNCDLLFVESGGDNLAANYSRELADYASAAFPIPRIIFFPAHLLTQIIYVIDVSGGDKIPRKGGPGISQSDLLVVNKIDIAEYVGASLEVMKRAQIKLQLGMTDAGRMRDGGPTLFTSVKRNEGVEGVAELIKGAWRAATGKEKGEYQ